MSTSEAWGWLKSIESTIDQAKQQIPVALASPSPLLTKQQQSTTASAVEEDDEFQDIEDEETAQSTSVLKDENPIRVKILAAVDDVPPSPPVPQPQVVVKEINNEKLIKIEEQLKVRERQLEQAQNELVSLRNENLKLSRLNEDIKMEAKEATDQFESLKNEFSERLAKEERKVMQLRKDKAELAQKCNQTSPQNDKIIEELTREGESLSKKVGQLEVSLRTAKSDKTALAKTIEENTTLIQNLEQQLKDKQQELVQLATTFDQKVLELHSTIDQLQETLIFTTEQAESKQEALRKEIDNLLKRVNMADSKREDTILTISDATLPLLQQIDRLEKATNAKEEQWKDAEQRLSYKLKIAENALHETQLERQKLQTHYEEQRNTIEELQRQIRNTNRELLHRNETIEKFQQQLSERDGDIAPIRQENVLLKRELEQLQILFGESRKEIERLYQSLEKYTSPQYTQNGTAKKVATEENTTTLSLKVEPPKQPIEQMTASEVLTTPATPSTPDGLSRFGLESEFRKQNAQILMFKKRVEELEELKDKLTDDVVSLTTNNKRLFKQLEDQDQLKQEYQETQKRYEAALELIGEKEEMLNDIQQDLKYVKEKFRIQITSLLEEIDQLKRSSK